MPTLTNDVVNKQDGEDGMNRSAQSRPMQTGENAQELVKFITTCLEDSKATEIVTIDLKGKTAIADAMIVASGTSRRHVGAIADRLIKRLKENGYKGLKIEGQQVGEWVLLDVGDVIVHIFQPEIRDFYNLEKMWSAERPEMGLV